MNLETRPLTTVVCYDRLSPDLDELDLSTYVMRVGVVEDLEGSGAPGERSLTDCQWVPPVDERLKADRGYMVCYEPGLHGHRPTPYLVLDGVALSCLEEFNDEFVAKGFVGLTDCVWLAPGTVEMCL